MYILLAQCKCECPISLCHMCLLPMCAQACIILHSVVNTLETKSSASRRWGVPMLLGILGEELWLCLPDGTTGEVGTLWWGGGATAASAICSKQVCSCNSNNHKPRIQRKQRQLEEEKEWRDRRVCLYTSMIHFSLVLAKTKRRCLLTLLMSTGINKKRAKWGSSILYPKYQS